MAKVGDEVLNQFQKAADNGMKIVDPDRVLKIGIIGTGWIAESHIESYHCVMLALVEGLTYR